MLDPAKLRHKGGATQREKAPRVANRHVASQRIEVLYHRMRQGHGQLYLPAGRIGDRGSLHDYCTSRHGVGSMPRLHSAAGDPFKPSWRVGADHREVQDRIRPRNENSGAPEVLIALLPALCVAVIVINWTRRRSSSATRPASPGAHNRGRTPVSFVLRQAPPSADANAPVLLGASPHRLFLLEEGRPHWQESQSAGYCM